MLTMSWIFSGFFLKPLLWGKPPQPQNFILMKEKIFTDYVQKKEEKSIKVGSQSMITKCLLYQPSLYA
jgi:hypothetical protein